MDTSNYIVKNEQTVPAEDYNFLRSKGLEYIEKLSGKIWTDYNVHDPGITMLELLCYAITDVSYRNSFEIKDLLTSQTDQGGIKELYTARQILTCNAVTVNDFRKELVDVEGVRNAWLYCAKKQEQEIFIDCRNSKLTYTNGPDYKELILHGLYDVVLELDDDIVLGDLNDYSFEEEYNDIKYTFNFPLWDFFYSRKLDPGDWTFDSYAYTQYISGTKVHEAVITIKSGSEIFTIPVTFVLDGRRKLTNEETIKTYLSAGGAKEFYNDYSQKVIAALKIVDGASKQLFEHRNLCEDFKSMSAVDVEEIALCANIEVSPEAEIEKIYAQILFEVGRFLAPEIMFYSLEDMLNADIPVEEIFEGPILDHGFIKDNELEKSELPDEIHVSDLINIIMDIEGVVAIDKIQIGSYHDGAAVNMGEKWCLVLGEGRAPRLRTNLADLTFFKGLIPYGTFDQEKISIYYQELLQSIRTAKLKKDEYDFPVPEGKYLDVADYISVQEEFPLVYGISRKGIPGLVDDKRRAQAKQLKAFLTLCDQLLANYLAQLSHLKDILSYRNDIDRTYFYQLPYLIPDAAADSLLHMKDSVPELYKLLNQFTGTLSSGIDIDNYKSYATLWGTFAKNEDNDFVKNLASYTEDTDTFEDRRNRFLDHLMGRFAEQFTDYVLLMYQLDGPRAAAELIEDKAAFLKDYVDISFSRGQAYNYRQCENLWTTGTVLGSNISGYEKRLSRLTGIDNYYRRILACDKTTAGYKVFKGTDSQWYFHFGETGDILLKSEGYTTKQSCEDGVESVIENGIEPENYDMETAIDGSFYYNLKAENNQIIGTSPMYTTEEERDKKYTQLITILKDNCFTEGFHLVEHILLRPKLDKYDLLSICIEPGCRSCVGFQDPYSFRMSLILPAWIGRFTDMNFRHHFENTARLEAPAHTHVKICWVDKPDMMAFEAAFKKWLKALCNDEMTSAIHNDLIKVMTEIKSVYPEGTLHDCAEDENENPIILGITNIGSTKSE